jgi:hypothetical protein
MYQHYLLPSSAEEAEGITTASGFLQSVRVFFEVQHRFRVERNFVKIVETVALISSVLLGCFLPNLLRLYESVVYRFHCDHCVQAKMRFMCVSRRTPSIRTKRELCPDKSASIRRRGEGSAANNGQAWSKTFVACQSKDKVGFLCVCHLL